MHSWHLYSSPPNHLITVHHFASIFSFTKALSSGGAAPRPRCTFPYHNNQLRWMAEKWFKYYEQNNYRLKKQVLKSIRLGNSCNLKFQLFRLMLCSLWARNQLKISTPFDLKMAFPSPLEKMHKSALGYRILEHVFTCFPRDMAYSKYLSTWLFSTSFEWSFLACAFTWCSFGLIDW